MRTLRALSVAGLAAALVLPVLPVGPAAAADPDPAAREWSQARGNSSRSAAATFEPILVDPVEAWKQPLPGAAIAEPVTWGGTIFAAAADGKGRRLFAFRATTGDALGNKDLGSGGRVGLASWQSVCIVGESDRIRGWPHQGDKFASNWTVKGKFSAPPCVYRGALFACDGDELVCLDARTGKKLAKAPVASAADLGMAPETKASKSVPVGGMVAVIEEEGVAYAVSIATLDTVVLLNKTRVDDLATGKPQLRYTATTVIGSLAVAPTENVRWSLHLARMEGEKGSGAWIVQGAEFQEGGSGRYVPDSAKAASMNIVTPVAVHAGVAYGFTKGGELVARGLDGSGDPLVAAGSLPPGARVGPATVARGILYFGNWAVDVTNRRVLWCCAAAEPATASVPAGDRRIVFATAKNELVCLADAALAPSPGGGDATADAPAGPPPAFPGDADGVLLTDGRFVEGDFQRSGDAVTVKPASGDSFDVPRSEIVVAQRGGEVDIAGDENDAYRVWRSAVRGQYVEALLALFAEELRSFQIDDCRRLIAAAREQGLSEARAQALDRQLTGKTNRPAPTARVKALKEQEVAARESAAQAYVTGCAWCDKRDMPSAATLLILVAGSFCGVIDSALEAKVQALVPEAFPWATAKDASAKWLTWAKELLPSGAEFLSKTDPAWERVKTAPWTEGTIGFRTRNLLLFCRDSDVAVVAPCLRNGEGAVRGVQALLNEGRQEHVGGDHDRLEVRIHRNREDYLKEETPSGTALPWSAGYFSPRECVSRFYVSRDAESEHPLARNLQTTLAHELTHHYIHQRWMGRLSRDGAGPGYWVVEGIAVFVEDQSVEIDRRGIAFDDPTVESLDAMAQAEGQNGLFPCGRLVEMTNDQFHKDLQSEGARIKVRLQHRFDDVWLSERGLYYQQAGALVFFLLNGRGPDGRQALVDYMRSYYRGGAPSSGWNALGFSSAEELDAEFKKFLRGIRGAR